MGIKKNYFSFFIVFFMTLLSCKTQKEVTDNKEYKKPNFIFILSDDQRFDAIGFTSNNQVKTPNLDKLAENGAVLSHTHNMGAWGGAICVASRSMVISGKSVWNAKREIEDPDTQHELIKNTWPRLLNDKGYSTYMTGKWHVQLPAEEIFDSVKTIRPGMPGDNRRLFSSGLRKWKKESDDITKLVDYMPLGYGRPIDAFDNSWQADDSIHGGFWQGGKHWSEVLADDAIGLINDAKEKENPFFLYLAFNAPHDPRQSPKEFLNMYPIESIKLPSNYADQHPYFNEIGNMPDVRDEALAPYPRSEFSIKKHLQEYYAVISHLDEQIGKILNHVRKNDLTQNTYIIFTSDHGLAIGQHGLMGKQSLYEHSIRVPMIISGPNIKKGARYGHDIYLQDIVPTTLDFADIEIPEEIDFNSFKDVLTEESNEPKNNGIYGTYGCCADNYYDYQRIIKKDGYKLMFFPKIRRLELYNIQTDPYETNNLANDNTYKDRIVSLAEDFIILQRKYNDTLDVRSIFKTIWEN